MKYQEMTWSTKIIKLTHQYFFLVDSRELSNELKATKSLVLRLK